MPTDQIKFDVICDGCVEVSLNVAAGSPTVTVQDTNGTLGTVTAGNTGTFNDYLWNGNTATVSIPDGSTVASGNITGTIKYTNCPTPTSTPASTPVPTPTPTAGAALTGGGDCSSAQAWPGYGATNKYNVDVSMSDKWFQVTSPSTRTVYGTLTTGATVTFRENTAFNPPDCDATTDNSKTDADFAAGFGFLVANPEGKFSLTTGMMGTAGIYEFWIV